MPLNKKILVELRTALNVDPKNQHMSHGNQRISEYVNGLKRFFEFEKQLLENNIEIYLTDNTIGKEEALDERILNIIPDYVKIITCENNIYGCKNKGAGLIEQWNYNKDLISCCDWYLYYEPRLLLINFDFFESFLKNPRTLFTLGSAILPHFNTGLFAMKSKNLLDYASSVNLEHMVQQNIGIEYSLYNFLNQNKIKYDIEEKMNVIWLDSFTNKKYLC